MVEEFIKIFEGLDRAYGTFERIKDRTAVKIQGKNLVIRGKPSTELWQSHLDGNGPGLGIMPLKDDGTCKWGLGMLGKKMEMLQHSKSFLRCIKNMHKMI